MVICDADLTTLGPISFILGSKLQTDTDRYREIQRETERDRQRERESEMRDRERETDRQADRQR